MSAEPSSEFDRPASEGAQRPPDLALEMLRELGAQREAFGAAESRAAAERKSERRWRVTFQILVFGMPIIFGLLYAAFLISTTGFRIGPWGDVAGVVRIEGAIGANERASADNLIPLLEKAFKDDNVKAVVLSIDSGGGAPVEAERIYTSLQALKAKHPKPTVAVINNIGASAAYMIALHADKIVVGRYTLVGSIGAIMTPWQLDRAIAKFDVSQRVYASGKLKSFLNPFTPVSPEMDSKAQALVDQLGGAFSQEVRQLRGSRLKPDFNLATGEVWSGPEALGLGLVDEVGTIDQYVSKAWGLQPYDYGPSAQNMSIFSRSVQDILVGAIQRLSVSMPQIR